MERKKIDMSKIPGKNTKPEIIVRGYLHRNGFRYKLHDKSLPGKPDLVLPKYNSVVFVHGCFWHNHRKCNLGKIPKNNQVYWLPKILGNVNRDKRQMKDLKRLDWNIIIIWECELTLERREKTLNKVVRNLLKQTDL